MVFAKEFEMLAKPPCNHSPFLFEEQSPGPWLNWAPFETVFEYRDVNCP